MSSSRVLLLGSALATLVAFGWLVLRGAERSPRPGGAGRVVVEAPPAPQRRDVLEPVGPAAHSSGEPDSERIELLPADVAVAPGERHAAPAPSAPESPERADEAPEPADEVLLVGPVTGRLLPESGTFGGDEAALLRGITIDLVSRSEPRVEARATLTPVYDDDGALTEIEFATNELPALEFEVTLASLDHRRWAPVAQSVVPPASEVTFLCYDTDQIVELEFIVTDAETGEPVDGWSATRFRSQPSDGNGVLLQAGPLDTDAFPLDARVRWTVEADGYAAAFGDERSFAPDPDTGKWTAHIALKRGFAARVVVLGKNPDRVLANGATIRLDGEFAGRTDAEGLVRLRRVAPPESISVRWGTQELSGTFADVCLARRGQLYVVLLDESEQ